ncbi:hypothetical protein HF086_015751 [Spodoptera exigua]|uniref:Uncharacterized protein n=1 Tax=Spodoptera exigua TaxID=7107 RepID=A0A922M1X9_SPOEX|nr:hypothetical protein HF086_015751 [Spodoptera exigua]
MENLDNNADRVASAVPQVRSSPRKRRVRSRSSSSSSSSCSSFESSSSTSGGSPKISRRNKKRGGKRKRLSERKFRKLTKEVRNLHRRIASQDSSQRVSTNLDYDAISLMSNINENSYEQMLDVEPSSFSASGDQEFTLSTNLFNAEKFTAAIEKSGGVRKCFWPLQKGNTSSASQADPNKFRGPSQGSKPYNKSLQGFSRNAQACQHITTHSQCVGSDPPSQGGCSHSNPPPQGDSNPRGHAAQYNSVAPNNRSNFRGRPNARQNNQSRHMRKRALSPQRNNDNKRRKY